MLFQSLQFTYPTKHYVSQLSLSSLRAMLLQNTVTVIKSDTLFLEVPKENKVTWTEVELSHLNNSYYGAGFLNLDLDERFVLHISDEVEKMVLDLELSAIIPLRIQRLE